MLLKKVNKKNFITFGVKNTISLEKVRSSFVLEKLKKIFLQWDIYFFRLINLRKKKINISKLVISKNTFFLFYLNFTNLLYFLKLNKEGINDSLNLFEISLNGYYLNYNFIKRWDFSNVLFEKLYFNLFYELLLSMFIKFLYILVCKFLVYLKFNFLVIKS